MKTILCTLAILFLYQVIIAQQKISQLPIVSHFHKKLIFGFTEKHCGEFINKGGSYDSTTQIVSNSGIYQRKRKSLIICGRGNCCMFRSNKIIEIDTPIIEKTIPILLPNSILFPNPAFEYVTLDIPYMATNMYVISSNGSILRTYNIEKTMQRKFFIGDLATGIYIILIFGREIPEKIKLIKTPI
jgi:hypothetical protein